MTKTNNASKKPEMLTKTDVKRMGFSEKMINDLLPAPIEKVNPHYKSGPSMKLWEKRIVLKAMKTKKFQIMSERHEKRSQAAIIAAITKSQKTLDEAREYIEKTEIPIMPMDELYEKSLEHVIEYKEEMHLMYPENERYFTYSVPSLDSEEGRAVRNRWAVNYIRHELTNYDYYLYMIKDRVGTDEAFLLIIRSINEKIAKAYPELADYCAAHTKTKTEATINKLIWKAR